MRRAHMQQKIIFKSKGLNCSGLFYLPDNYSATDDVKLPAIAMAHGMGTTKEVGLPQFAERFADASHRLTRNGSASGVSLSLGGTCFRSPPSTAALNVSWHRFLRLVAS